MINCNEIEEELTQIIKTITGLKDYFIRISFQPQGMPGLTTGKDYIFVTLCTNDKPIDKQIEEHETYNPQKDKIIVGRFSTTCLEAKLVLYGNNCLDNALKIKSLIGDKLLTRNLRRNQIYLNPAIEAPKRIPIKLNAVIWNQAYLNIKFNMGTAYTLERDYIETARIELIADTGITKDINLEKGE